MKLLVLIYYHGDVQIEYWEYALSTVYVLFFYLYFARRKNQMIGRAPEYRFYLWGLMAKLASAVVFSLIYFYYYQGGDSTAYFYSGVAMRNMALYDPLEYLRQLFGDNSVRAWSAYPSFMARPYQYVFFDNRTFVVVALSSMLALLTFKSYLISTLMIASLSFFGVWACFRTFVSYFPQITRQLAIGFLFMPSSIFWGSAILKDTISFSAACWWVHAVDEVFFKRRDKISKSVVIAISGFMMILVKPYIFMVLFPATMFWLLYNRVARLKNALVRFVLMPIMGIGLLAGSLLVLEKMGTRLDKFALQGAMETMQVVQGDMIKYGSNSFNVGRMDGTGLGMLAKFPTATNAALFRPYIWECNNVVMVMSGLENLWVLALVVMTLIRAGPAFLVRAIIGNPLVLMSIVFALLFAFIVGLTTPNFGALVRFKIPMVPFFISSIFVVSYMARLKRKAQNNGRRFNLVEFRMGTAHLSGDVQVRKKKARPRGFPSDDPGFAGPVAG